jgi:hypothetical protein
MPDDGANGSGFTGLGADAKTGDDANGTGLIGLGAYVQRLAQRASSNDDGESTGSHAGTQAFIDLGAYEQRLALRAHPQLRQRLLLLYAAQEVQCTALRWCTCPELFSTMVWYAAAKAGSATTDTPGAHRGARSQLLQHLALITARRLVRGFGCLLSEMFLLELCERYKVYICAWEHSEDAEHVLLENVRQIVGTTRAYGAEGELRDVVLQLLRVFFARDPITADSLVPLLEYHLVVPAGIGQTLPPPQPTSPFADMRSEQQQRVVRAFLADARAVLAHGPE